MSAIFAEGMEQHKKGDYQRAYVVFMLAAMQFPSHADVCLSSSSSYSTWPTQGIVNAGMMLAALLRNDHALAHYAYALHAYPTNERARTQYVHQLQVNAQEFSKASEYVLAIVRCVVKAPQITKHTLEFRLAIFFRATLCSISIGGERIA